MNIIRHIARATATLAIAGAALATAGTAFADTPGLTVSGDATGTVTHAAVSCVPLGNGNYSWELKGRVDQAPIDITFTTAAFHGAGTYKTTGITDDAGGLATLETGDLQVVTNGDTVGSFTIDQHEHSGSINTDLTNNGQHVHVQGHWTCS